MWSASQKQGDKLDNYKQSVPSCFRPPPHAINLDGLAAYLGRTPKDEGGSSRPSGGYHGLIAQHGSAIPTGVAIGVIRSLSAQMNTMKEGERRRVFRPSELEEVCPALPSVLEIVKFPPKGTYLLVLRYRRDFQLPVMTGPHFTMHHVTARPQTASPAV